MWGDAVGRAGGQGGRERLRVTGRDRLARGVAARRRADAVVAVGVRRVVVVEGGSTAGRSDQVDLDVGKTRLAAVTGSVSVRVNELRARLRSVLTVAEVVPRVDVAGGQGHDPAAATVRARAVSRARGRSGRERLRVPARDRLARRVAAGRGDNAVRAVAVRERVLVEGGTASCRAGEMDLDVCEPRLAGVTGSVSVRVGELRARLRSVLEVAEVVARVVGAGHRERVAPRCQAGKAGLGGAIRVPRGS